MIGRMIRQGEIERSEIMAVTTRQGFLRQAWHLAWPYWRSEEKWSAIGLLAAVIALNLITVWLNVRFNYWNNDFYNALQQYEWPEFWRQFAIFGALALAFIVVGVYSSYLRGILHLCRCRHNADPMDRLPADPPQFRPAALRGGFSVQHGSVARECGERRLLRRRSPRVRHVPNPLRARRRELVGNHKAPQEADLVHV